MLRRKIFALTFVQCGITYQGRMVEPGHPICGEIRAGREPMMKNFEDVQKLSKDNMDTTLKSFGAVSKGFQAIAVEMADFSKKSFEEGTAAIEKLMGVKSFDKAIEVQTDYFKSSYEGLMSEATKLGDLYTDLAKETYKPFEGVFGKVNGVS
jgi:hypothetical protein